MKAHLIIRGYKPLGKGARTRSDHILNGPGAGRDDPELNAEILREFCLGVCILMAHDGILFIPLTLSLAYILRVTDYSIRFEIGY